MKLYINKKTGKIKTTPGKNFKELIYEDVDIDEVEKELKNLLYENMAIIKKNKEILSWKQVQLKFM